MAAEQGQTNWKVLEHGPIETLAQNLWFVSGALPGMSLRRSMIVARREDGTLVIHNAIALEESAQRQLEGFGTPAVLVVPNGYHRLDAPAYKARYPQLQVFAPSGSRAKVAQMVEVDGAYEEYSHEDDSVQLCPLAGVGDLEGVMLVRSSDGVTVVLNDAMFNMDTKKDFLGWAITTILGSAPGPRVSRLAKFAFVKDKKRLRAEFERLAALPELVRVSVAHEKVARGHEEARAALLKAATYL